MSQQTKTKNKVSAASIILIVLLALVAVVLVYSIINSFGVFGRMSTAVKSDNYRVNKNELQVYKYQVAQNQLYTAYLYDAYGLTQNNLQETFGSPDNYINYMINYYNTYAPDTFLPDAYAYAEQYVVYCEGAKEAGVTLDDEEKKQIDDYIQLLKDTAKANDISLSEYLKGWIGSGVSKGDVRKAMEKYYLSLKYAQQKEDELTGSYSEDEITKYVEDNKSDFYSSSYTYYALVNESLEEKFKSAKTVDDAKRIIINYYYDQKIEELYKTNVTDKGLTDEAPDVTKADVLNTVLCWEGVDGAAHDDAPFNKSVPADSEEITLEGAGYLMATGIDGAAKQEIAKIYTTGSAAYADPNGESATDLQKWLFGDGRAVNDTNVIKAEKTGSDGTKTTTVTWYLVTETLGLKTEKTKNAYYIALTDDAAEVENGKTAAQKWDAFKADPTAENFKTVFGATMTESISKAGVADELGEWLYAEGRKEGDFEKITSGSTDYAVLYQSENDETWKVNARSALANEALTDWFEEMKTKFHVTSSYEEPETEAATA